MFDYLSKKARGKKPSRTKVRLGRVAGRALTHLGADPVVTVTTEAGVFRLDARSRTEAGLLWNGERDLDDVAFLQAVTPENGTFVDIGANVGMIFIPVARSLGRDGFALAIEPVPANVGRLRDAVGRNALHCRAEVSPLAVGREVGEIHLVKEGRRNASGNAVPSLVLGHGVKVEQSTLDVIAKEQGLRRLDTIKIDVEGYELEVLLGAQETVRSFRPIVFGEFNNILMPKRNASFRDIWGMFEPMGYACFSFTGRCALARRRTPPDNLGNAVLIPRERLAGLAEAGITFDAGALDE